MLRPLYYKARRRAQLFGAALAVRLNLPHERSWLRHSSDAFTRHFLSRETAYKDSAVHGLLSRWRARLPSDPQPALYLAMLAYYHGDPESYQLFEAYYDAQRALRRRLGLEDEGTEHLPESIFCGALGNHWCLYNLIESQRLGLKEPGKLIFTRRKGARLTNPALFEYFREHIEVVEAGDPRARPLEWRERAQWFLGCFTPFKGFGLFLEHGHAIIHQASEGRPPLLTLTDAHRARGRKVLASHGLKADDWFVALHIRESNDSQDIRNAKASNYLAAIREITGRGGWVIRLGDRKMTPLPTLERVVDYPFTADKSEWMDVFLAADCRFQLGGSSGPRILSQMFGAPTLCVNGLPYLNCAYTLSKRDMYLPKILRREDGSLVRLTEAIVPPISMLTFSYLYAHHGLSWIDNTEEELAEATRDMLDYTEGRYAMSQDEARMQKSFADASARAADQYRKYSGRIAAQPLIPKSFMNRHRDLLG